RRHHHDDAGHTHRRHRGGSLLSARPRVPCGRCRRDHRVDQDPLRSAAEGDLRMTAAVLPWVEAAFILAFLCSAWRLLRGPELPDRILALDTLYVNAIALLVLFGIEYDTQLLFEAALVVALLGFVGTVALAKYVTRGDI